MTMGRILEELWVATDAGLNVFHWRDQDWDNATDPSIFSGFMNVVQSMFGVDRQRVEFMEMGAHAIGFHTGNTFTFIGLFKRNASRKVARKLLDRIGMEFEVRYREKSPCEVSLFLDFEHVIEGIA